MPLTAGTRVGPYEIISAIGAGGMGEVYRGTDTRLGRSVAIKILPEHVAGNAVRRERLTREARAVSRLSHPHICPLYDLGEQNGLQFLVMEYLEGETLAQRLRRGALPIATVVRTAIEIADALDHAHQQGIVHRDLKPANIMLTHTGAKLLDFGLARFESADPVSAAAHGPRPTVTDGLTEEGAIVGTVQYMTPEQLEDRQVDSRTDIFAFGAVVYEMATGRVAFEGASKARIIAAVLERTPDPVSTVRSSSVGDDTPPLLDQIVSRCLAKTPDERWQTASDLKQALRWIGEGTANAADRRWSPFRRPTRYRAGIAASLVLIASAVTVTVMRNAGGVGNADQPWRYTVSAPPNTTFNPAAPSLAISPDGNHLAFVASSPEGGGALGTALWIRSRDATEPRQLRGTAGAAQPFWSPDSRVVAFYADGKLKKVEVVTQITETLADIHFQAGTWNRDGVLLFPVWAGDRRYTRYGLYRVPASGGTPALVATHQGGSPQFLPDGRHFLYVKRSDDPNDDGMLQVGSLESPEQIQLFRAESHAVYASGYLLFLRQQSLFAQPFDPNTFRLTGEPQAVAEYVERGAALRGAFSASEKGVLAYRPVGHTQLAWFDRNGRRLESIAEPGRYTDPALSPDGLRLAVRRRDPLTPESSIWIIDLKRGLQSKLTVDPGPEPRKPVWSPDGSRIVYQAGPQFVMKASTGTGPEERLLENLTSFDSPLGWSPDGQQLIYDAADSKIGTHLWMVPIDGDRNPIPLLNSGPAIKELQGQVSPDGRWLAYVSDERGRQDVYVRPFPSGREKWLISPQGGIEPAWRGDGQELFYLAGDRSLMAVAIAGGRTFEASMPIRLFETKMSTVMNTSMVRNQYVVTRDGQRFLINQPTGDPPAITVIVNWPSLLKK
jgi:serine/threonine protein kinase/Tol biopolymer transport system component